MEGEHGDHMVRVKIRVEVPNDCLTLVCFGNIQEKRLMISLVLRVLTVSKYLCACFTSGRRDSSRQTIHLQDFFKGCSAQGLRVSGSC